MTKRIFTSIILASVIVLLASGGLTMGVLYNHFGNQLEEELRLTLSPQRPKGSPILTQTVQCFLTIVPMRMTWKTIWTERRSRKLWKMAAVWL